MRELILKRINKIKSVEQDFRSKWWQDVYISADNYNSPIVLSMVNFGELSDLDLARIFEYVVLMQQDVISKRVNETYFKQ